MADFLPTPGNLLSSSTALLIVLDENSMSRRQNCTFYELFRRQIVEYEKLFHNIPEEFLVLGNTITFGHHMFSATTYQVKVSVQSAYQSRASKPEEGHYVFGYKVHIENLGTETVQLLKRHWHIHDLAGVEREIRGDGVIGEKPILEPGETHEYISWSVLPTPMGKMFGDYLFQRHSDGSYFNVEIPVFHLIPTHLLN
jgi:ApaG protein